MGIIPLMSSLVSFLFAIIVLDQYFAKRKPFQLVWAIGLFMYCVSTLTEFWTETFGLNTNIYRLWYLFGAILVAAYLGMGTAYLLARRRIANIILIVLLISSVYATFKVFTANIDLTLIDSLSGKAMPEDVRLITPLFNVFGTVLLVGGAIYSAWIYWIKRVHFHRVISNLLIALGAILPAIGGGLLRFFNTLSVFYVLEFIGIVVLFIGFLKTKEVLGLFRFPLIHGFAKVPENNVTRISKPM